MSVVARRAVIRWGVRLFRREWRQQLLVLGLLTVAVAATTWGTSVITNVQLPDPNHPTYGTAAAQVTLPGTDPRLTADIAAIQASWGPADLIENQDIANGTTRPVQLRAENPHGHYNSPLLSLVSGSYPAGAGHVAVTSQVAAQYGTNVGGTWRAAGTSWRVTGIVQDPSNLADKFALVAPGQVSHPRQVIMLLGPAAAQRAMSGGNGALPGIPVATVSVPSGTVGGLSPATAVLLVEVLGLAFIGLVSVAGFSVMAQRRLRALGMFSAIGATASNLRLVVIINGLAVGVAGALAGTVLGFAAWLAYAPELQQATGHVVGATSVPWWAIATGIVFATATPVLASRGPARTIARVPVVAALSGRPAPPKHLHRSVVPGVIVAAGGLACLAFTGGVAEAGRGYGHALLLLAGLVATITGIFLLAPLAISVLTAAAGPRLPVAIRVALRDLVRYRARSGAALAATTFAVFLAMAICVVASLKFDDPLNWSGPNLSSSQLAVYTYDQNGGMMTQLSDAQVASLGRPVSNLGASLHAQSVLPLEFAVMLSQMGAPDHDNFSGTVYVATPQLLAMYGIKASQIAPGTDVLTMRPGLAGLPRMEMSWGNYGECSGTCIAGHEPAAPPCRVSNDCLVNPVIQTVSSLPGGTSEPNTVITQYAVSRYHLQPSLYGWLIQAPAPLTAAQVSAARQFALTHGVTIETRSGGPSLGDITDGATALGIVIALGVLAASVGLIRSETARDLRTLTAIGASGATRRMITAATAAGIGLLGAVLGMAGALAAGLAFAHGSLSAMFSDVPLSDMLILLAGLPLTAAAASWVFAGRKPPEIARQPIE